MVVLYIDDDKDDAEIFCDALEYLNQNDLIDVHARNHVVCLTANDGQKAFEMLEKSDELPAYIFCDCNMPVMGGTETLKRLKESEKFQHIPVVMLSTRMEAEDIETYKDLGANDCFKKPADFNALVKILAKYTF